MKFLRTLVTLALVGFVSIAAQAQEHGTKEEAKALAERAAAHIKSVGAEKAFNDFTNDKASWNKKDLYVFVNSIDGTTLAHGGNEKLIGKNMVELKDQNGKPFIKDMGEMARTKGAGWVDYDWVNPQTKKVAGKTSYVIKLSNQDAYVGVGVYR